jgi:hypothetical protein
MHGYCGDMRTAGANLYSTFVLTVRDVFANCTVPEFQIRFDYGKLFCGYSGVVVFCLLCQ